MGQTGFFHQQEVEHAEGCALLNGEDLTYDWRSSADDMEPRRETRYEATVWVVPGSSELNNCGEELRQILAMICTWRSAQVSELHEECISEMRRRSAWAECLFLRIF